MSTIRRSPLVWLWSLGCLLAGSQAEVRAQSNDKALQQHFARLDKNGDKTVSRKEFAGSDRQFQSLDVQKIAAHGRIGKPGDNTDLVLFFGKTKAELFNAQEVFKII